VVGVVAAVVNVVWVVLVVVVWFGIQSNYERTVKDALAICWLLKLGAVLAALLTVSFKCTEELFCLVFIFFNKIPST